MIHVLIGILLAPTLFFIFLLLWCIVANIFSINCTDKRAIAFATIDLTLSVCLTLLILAGVS